MNRHQRRRARRKQAKHGAAFVGCTDAELNGAIVAAEQSGHPGIAEILREMMTGTLAMVQATDRAAMIDSADLRAIPGDVVAVVGDDDYRTTGPAGWACASTIAAWAECAVVHGAAGTADTYREAIRGAHMHARCALIETASSQVEAWAALFVGKPILLVVPTDVPHPIMPTRECWH